MNVTPRIPTHGYRWLILRARCHPLKKKNRSLCIFAAISNQILQARPEGLGHRSHQFGPLPMSILLKGYYG